MRSNRPLFAGGVAVTGETSERPPRPSDAGGRAASERTTNMAKFGRRRLAAARPGADRESRYQLCTWRWQRSANAVLSRGLLEPASVCPVGATRALTAAWAAPGTNSGVAWAALADSISRVAAERRRLHSHAVAARHDLPRGPLQRVAAVGERVPGRCLRRPRARGRERHQSERDRCRPPQPTSDTHPPHPARRYQSNGWRAPHPEWRSRAAHREVERPGVTLRVGRYAASSRR